MKIFKYFNLMLINVYFSFFIGFWCVLDAFTVKLVLVSSIAVKLQRIERFETTRTDACLGLTGFTGWFFMIGVLA